LNIYLKVSAWLIHTPLNEGVIIDDLPDPSINTSEYQRGIGSLQYLSDKTRPDIARAANFLAEYNSKPTPKGWNALKHVLRYYLAGTRNRGITYKKCIDSNPATSLPMPSCHTDSDWAGTLVTDRGRYIYLPSCKRPHKLEVKEADVYCYQLEHIAASEAARQATWIRFLLWDMGLFENLDLPPILIY
jgi:hypothetical protein